MPHGRWSNSNPRHSNDHWQFPAFVDETGKMCFLVDPSLSKHRQHVLSTHGAGDNSSRGLLGQSPRVAK